MKFFVQLFYIRESRSLWLNFGNNVRFIQFCHSCRTVKSLYVTSCIILAGWDWYSWTYCAWDIKAGIHLLLSFVYLFCCIVGHMEEEAIYVIMIENILDWFISFICHLQTKAPVEETRKKICLVDSKVVEGLIEILWRTKSLSASLCIHFLFCMQGLIVSSRKDSLQHFKKPWAHEHEPVNNLLDAVKVFTDVSSINVQFFQCLWVLKLLLSLS